MPTQLSPNEQVAQAMLLLHGKDPIEALNVMNAATSAIADVFANDPDPSEDDVNNATQSAIQKLGYATDLDSISKQYDYLKDNHAGFWSGNYTIVDSNNEVHSLLINSTNTRLLLDGTDEVLNIPSEGGGFSQQKLTASNAKVDVAFTFSTPADGVDLTADTTDLADLAKRMQVMLTGTLTVKADGAARTIRGKRGVSTPAGVFHPLGEEPQWIWAGEYSLIYTDTALWDPYGDTLVIAYDAGSKALTAQLGPLQGTGVFYRNSVLGFRVELTKGVVTQVTMEMHATSRGGRKCYVWFETTGQIRTLTGYPSDTLDHAVLWNDPGSADPTPVVRNPLRAMAANSSFGEATSTALGATLSTGGIVDFCRTPYDSTISASELMKAAGSAGDVNPATLFAGDTITVAKIPAIPAKDGNPAVAEVPAHTVAGYRVDEVGADGNATGRIGLFTYAAPVAPATEKHFFPAGAKLKSYQQLDEAGLPQGGLSNAVVGVLSAKAYELPGLVETDFYEVRLSLTDFASLLDDTGQAVAGLSITLAIDDAMQRKLIRLAQNSSSTNCTYSATTGDGPDQAVAKLIGDYTKASVLVRGATGETQNVGQKDYYFAVSPKSKAGFVPVTMTAYKPSGEPDGSFVQDGAPSKVLVPILLHIPIQMDSRDALELAGNTWAPAARGRKYAGRVTAMKGQQPFAWRLLTDDKPPGLTWEPAATVGTDISTAGLISFGLTGTVNSDANPGDTYQPAIRIMSDKGCVMKPIVANPQITIAEPETEMKVANEIANTVSTVAAAIAAIASIVMGVVIYKKQTAREKNEGSKTAIDLNDLSVDNLGNISQKFEEIADAARDIQKNDRYVSRLTDALSAYENAMPKMAQAIQDLNSAIDRAGSAQEIADLKDRVERQKERLEANEKERNKERERRDVVDESSSHESK